MNLYWYWPFLRREELVLAAGVLRPADTLVVHTTARAADPISSTLPGCAVRATLPGVPDAREGSIAWAAGRASTYVRRAAARRRAVRAGGFDVAHVVYLNPFTDAFDLAWLRRRVPLVCSVHDVVPHNTRVPAPLERRLLGAQYRNAGTIVVHHEFVRRRLLAEFGIDPSRIEVVPLPVPELAPPVTARPEGPPVVLFFGTFRRNKGVALLLRAIGALRDETDARFVFAGRGMPEIEQAVRDAARRDPRVVAEIGYVTATRKLELYADADLVVLPYTSFASQSAVLRDAYALRVPLVVTDVGALGETVRADRTGWTVPAGNADALPQTLLAALRDEPARRAARGAADAVARTRTPDLIGHRLRAIYDRVASGAPR